MNNLKSHLTCQYCTKILKQPMTLPCGHTLCEEHLHDNNFVNENKIECVSCRRVFNLNECHLVQVEIIQNLIREETYLSDEEKSLKSKLIESFSALNRLKQEFESEKETFRHFDLESLEHFQEIRRQIDIHRESDEYNACRTQIDSIALNMIEQTKDFESKNFKCMNEIVKENLLVHVTSLDVEKETQTLRELYRDPFLEIDSIEKMSVDLYKKIQKLEVCLHELLSIRAHLRSNNFQPNDQATVGVLILNEFMNNLSLSSILSRRQSNELIRLCELSFMDKFTLIYKASRDGFGAEAFHLKCDGHANTLTIFKAKETEFIFGAFTSAAWQSISHQYKCDEKAFLFSLTNRDNRPCKMKIQESKCRNAVYSSPRYGPTFGGGHDIYIANNANSRASSYSNLGLTFVHPEYEYESNETRTFLAGSYNFQLSEIET
jgi:hypothetical protein